ncbi:MAG: chemotaxis protein CheC [Candidatus Bathyarchaeota archaeon]|nr:chemotaxis protein CheC [Candidatus Bathyarchaeota archaeon]
MNELVSSKIDNFESLTDRDILLEIGNMGAGHATTALSQVLQEPIAIELPRVHMTSPHLVPSIYGKHDTIVAAVFMQLRGAADCDVMLIFEEKECARIAELMTNGMEVTPEIQRSAIEEMGSIVLTSFLSAMANFTSTKLVMTPPQLIVDSFDAIIDGLIIKQALCSDVAVIFDARFKRYNTSTEGFLITFLGDELQKILIQKGKRWLTGDSINEEPADHAVDDIFDYGTVCYTQGGNVRDGNG